MAKKKEEFNYAAAISRLQSGGPSCLYLLWGPEDYLREQYSNELRRLCLPDGEDSFSYHRFDGPELDAEKLGEALDSMPFLSSRTLIELYNVDINKLTPPESYIKLLSDIPEYCTVVFIQSSAYEVDGRMKLTKHIRTSGTEVKFSTQGQGQLVAWIGRRFAAAGKGIELEAAQRLLFVSGQLMSRLIPEIEKIAAYARGDKVTAADVDAVANHIPEAVIFDMTDYLSKKKINSAMSELTELLADKNNEPIPMTAMLGLQMRRLYCAKLATQMQLGTKFISEALNLKNDSSNYIAGMLQSAARGFTLPQLIRAVELCAETDFKMKSSSIDSRELLKELVLRIAAGETNA